MDVRERLEEGLAGRYHVERRIGEGGMAEVYLARDLKHRREVALKVLRPEISTGRGSERFRREIEAAAGLNHPNVLPLHDSGEASGLLYFVMPFVEGESLRARLNREGRLPVEESLRIANEVGDALAYAHGHGLVHRDVKPENILFQAGHALVCDFGIAQATSHAEERLTRTDHAVGTTAYMSPEQFEAGRAVDQRTDIYALGCMLHEMLSGEVPFAAGSPQASLARKLTGTLTDLAATRPDVPVTIQAVIQRAVSVDPEARHATAEEFVGALRTAATLRAQEADRTRRYRQRNVRRALLGAAAVALASASWWALQSLGAPRMERIAVLPFDNTVADSTQDFYVQGVHRDLILELSKAVRVINPGSVVQYAGTTLPVREIAAELRVDGVVQGTVTRGPAGLSLNLHLVDGDTEEIVWSQAFDGALSDVVSVYHRVAFAVAEEMGVALTSETADRLAVSQEVDPQVYDALLQARFHWQKLTKSGIDTAERYYELALERDSLSAEAWMGLAQVWGMRAQQGFVSGADATRRAAPYLERAIALDPSLASLQSQLALRTVWGEWRLQDGRQIFVEALDTDPTDSLLRAYFAQLLLYLGEDDEAMAQGERAASLDPFNTLVQTVFAQCLVFLHRYAEAEAVLLRSKARDPEAPYVLSTLRTTYHLMGRQEEALEMFRTSYETTGDLAAVAALDAGYQEGGYSAALRAVAELFVERAKTEYVTPWQIATLYTRAGDAAPALEYLQLAYRDRDQNMPSILVDPIFDFMRDEPGFQALVDSLGVPR